jgi:hypothetical protein
LKNSSGRGKVCAGSADRKMKPGKHITEWLAIAAMAFGVAIPVPGVAQRAFHPHTPIYLAQQAPGVPPGHVGDWLRRYKDLPPGEQERELRKDPVFQRLTPPQQQLLLRRLRHFSSLPPQEQLRMLNRMETWEHLTPAQKQQALQIFAQMRQLPPARQRILFNAMHGMRALPPAERDRLIDSPGFRGRFTDQERDLMHGFTRLPVAPAEEP